MQNAIIVLNAGSSSIKFSLFVERKETLDEVTDRVFRQGWLPRLKRAGVRMAIYRYLKTRRVERRSQARQTVIGQVGHPTVQDAEARVGETGPATPPPASEPVETTDGMANPVGETPSRSGDPSATETVVSVPTPIPFVDGRGSETEN